MVVELHTTKTKGGWQSAWVFNFCSSKNDEKRDCLCQPTQTKSAFKNFTIQYRLKRSNGYDPESFLLNSKQPITNIMIKHDKLMLNWYFVYDGEGWSKKWWSDSKRGSISF